MGTQTVYHYQKILCFFFLSDCFIIGKKGIFNGTKWNKISKFFWGVSLLELYFTSSPMCITLQFHRNWYLRLQFELKWNLLHQKRASRYWFINIIKLKIKQFEWLFYYSRMDNIWVIYYHYWVKRNENKEQRRKNK